MLALTGLAPVGSQAASAQPTRPPEPPSGLGWVAGEVVVIPESLERGRALREQAIQEQFTVLGFAPISGLMIVAVEVGMEEVAITHFRSLEGVRAAERSPRGQLGGAGRTPSICGGRGVPPTPDPGFASQWYLHNTGQVVTGFVGAGNETIAGTCGVDIDAVRAWQRTRGSPDIWLAVFDSGIDKDEFGVVNPEFAGRLVPVGPEISLSCAAITGGAPSTCCCTGGTCNFGEAFDVDGHGTWVTGVAAANHDGVGVMGVDPSCTILPVRVIAQDSGKLARTIVALELIDDNNGPGQAYEKVRVINMSYVCAFTDVETSQTVLLNARLDALRAESVFLVSIASNDDTPTGKADLNLPGASPSVICVGASDNLDRRADFTYLSPGAFESGTGAALDFLAPGFAGITVDCENQLFIPCNWHCERIGFDPPLSGTSNSAPIVSGIITLLLARADTLSVTLGWNDVYELLKAGAKDLGDSGRDDEHGWGRVNAYESLMALERAPYYLCDADVTHTDDEMDFGYGVPDGKVDPDDMSAFLGWYGDGDLLADVTSTGFVTPGGGGANGIPDGMLTSDDFIYFMSFYSNCAALGLCPACP